MGAQSPGYDLGNDDLLGTMDQIEVAEFDNSLHSSRLLYPPSKEGLGSSESIALDGEHYGESLSSTTTVEMTIPGEEDVFMTLLNNTDFNFQMDDFNAYHGKEPLVPTFSAFLPPPAISTSTTVRSSSSDTVPPRYFTKNNVQTRIQQTYATMIIEMIHAYPRMMIRRGTLPPFIHAYSPAINTENDQNRLPKYLVNCMGISQLFAVRNDDTHPFLWTTIRAEMRTFRDRIGTSDKHEMFSALQASLVYLIIRAVDDAPQEAKDDYEMISTYQVCFTLSYSK